MTEHEQVPPPPTERLMQAWIYQSRWILEEAVLLALGVSPDDDKAAEVLDVNSALLARAKRSGERSGAPGFWLWWAERNNLPFHTDWWLAITPEDPIGFDGQHFAHHRREMLSAEYLRQERRLIGIWARKPYWTQREAIDLSLNFEPFTSDGWRGDAPETGETIREREDRFRILERAKEIGEIAEKASPQDYLLWLKSRGYYVSEAWRRAVGITDQNTQQADAGHLSELAAENATLIRQLEEKSARIEELEQEIEAEKPKSAERLEEVSKLKKRIRQLLDGPATPSEKGALARRIEYLERTLLAAAVDGYAYDPRQLKSDAPQQMANKAGELGCPLTAQTVRKQLKESADNHVESSVWDVIYPAK